MKGPGRSSVSYIPLGVPFLAALVRGLLDQTKDHPEDLMRLRILLPTRRAVRTLRDLFLDATDGMPLLLPRLQAIGDVDGDELDILVAGETGAVPDIAPAISPIQRLSILAEQVQACDSTMDYTRALDLAAALAQLIDAVENEGLDFSTLDRLVADRFAGHWQLTLTFLDIVRLTWPEILAAQGCIDAAKRRNLLLMTLNSYWQNNPPAYPVIVAGVTGSLPVVANLMNVVRQLPQGEVILAGYDPDFVTDWDQDIDTLHPFYDLKNILSHFGIESSELVPWAGFRQSDRHDQSTDRSWLWAQAMTIAEKTSKWAHLNKTGAPERIDCALQSLDYLKIIEAETPDEEANAVAFCVRQTLSHSGKTVAVVTSDRTLSARIIAACGRYGIALNDSAGEILSHTPSSGFMRLILDVVLNQLHPVDVLALIGHAYFGQDIPDLARIEARGLRGLRPPRRPETFVHEIEQRLGDIPLSSGFLYTISVFAPLIDQGGQKKQVREWVLQHIALAEDLAAQDDQGHSMLWNNEDGESLAHLLAELLAPELVLPRMDLAEYAAFFTHLCDDRRVNRRFEAHPRAVLLGLFESRLTGADHIILAGMNEGKWPPDPGHDPWLSRGMRHDFGLPPLDVNVARTAHDFLQLVMAKRVTLTRTRRQDGVITIPSRWLQRLDTVLAALDPGRAPALRDHEILLRIRGYDRPEMAPRPVLRPQPCPPVAWRPDTLSATQIGTLMVDPYAIYAYKILNLKKWDDFDEDVSARHIGQIIHKTLQDFNARGADPLLSVAPRHLADFLEDALGFYIKDPVQQVQNRPRLQAILAAYLVYEREWRIESGAKPVGTETRRFTTMSVRGSPFVLHAIIDRVDRLPNGDMAVIDYKTGTNPSRTEVLNGTKPQLPIEAWLAVNGQNDGDVPAQASVAASMAFWQLGPRETKILQWDDGSKPPVADVINQTIGGVARLLDVFADDTTPYHSEPRHNMKPEFSNYRHLARVIEWSDQDEDGTGDA